MFYPRQIYASLLQQKDTHKIALLLGPRQVGKTTLLKQLQRELGGLYLDVDLTSHYQQIANYPQLINTLQLHGYKPEQSQIFYLFLDEFHRYPELVMTLKNCVDHHPNLKIYATGSSSLAIKQHVQESLAGRKRTTLIYPLSFREYLLFQDRPDLVKQLVNLETLESENYAALIPDIMGYLNTFMVYGGYPEVVLTPEKERIEVLASIFDLYLRKDLVDYIQPEKLYSSRLLVQQLAINHGHQANYSQYGSNVHLDTKTIKHYISLLQETFLILTMKPYFSNKNNEISKMPKVYFLDNGVRNYFCNYFASVDTREDAGRLFESFYIGELLKSGEAPENLKYYRSKAGDEVDLILDRVSAQIPIEIKFKTKLKASDSRPLLKFMEHYQLNQGYLVNLGLKQQRDKVVFMDCFHPVK